MNICTINHWVPIKFQVLYNKSNNIIHTCMRDLLLDILYVRNYVCMQVCIPCVYVCIAVYMPMHNMQHSATTKKTHCAVQVACSRAFAL